VPGLELGAVLRASLLAALAAALLTAAFHLVLTERLIQQAIELEEQLRGPARDAEVVSRPVQRAGLVLGFLLYGVTFGLLFAATCWTMHRWVPGVGARTLALLLALAGGWSVAVLPFLKYPANPPGVGDPATIGQRQRLYLGFVALSVAGAVAAFALDRLLARARARPPGRARRLLLVLALYAGYAAVVFALMPPASDPIPLPLELVRTFRFLSLAGLALFWLVLGVLAAWLLERRAGGQERTPRPDRAAERTPG
jgi:hypothetical protein